MPEIINFISFSGRLKDSFVNLREYCNQKFLIFKD